MPTRMEMMNLIFDASIYYTKSVVSQRSVFGFLHNI